MRQHNSLFSIKINAEIFSDKFHAINISPDATTRSVVGNVNDKLRIYSFPGFVKWRGMCRQTSTCANFVVINRM